MRSKNRASTHVVYTTLCESLSPRRVHVVQQFVEQDDLALEFRELCEGLRPIVRLCLGICAGERLHQLLRRGEVSWSASPNELLQLRLLCFAIFRFKLLCRLQCLGGALAPTAQRHSCEARE